MKEIIATIIGGGIGIAAILILGVGVESHNHILSFIGGFIIGAIGARWGALEFGRE